MITVKNISYHLSGKTILHDVSAKFEPGKLNLIIGPNGAGKSSLIKIISNQVKPSSGQVYYGSEDVNNFSTLKLARVRSVLSQNTHLAFPLKVRELVMMGRYPHFDGRPAKQDESACDEAMRLFEIEEFSERNCLTLSGGEMQRVQFARVLAQIWHSVNDSCRYLILDEPLTFLDVYYQHQFMHKIAEFMKGDDIVTIGVLHDLNLAAKFADELVLLHQGIVVAQGSPDKVLSKENIEAVYHLEPTILNQNGSKYLFFD